MTIDWVRCYTLLTKITKNRTEPKPRFLLENRTENGISGIVTALSSTHIRCQSTRLYCFGRCIGFVSHPWANPLPTVCSDIPLCVQHSTAPAYLTDSWGCCLSLSVLCRLSDVAGAVNQSINSWWLCVSCGCSMGVEQSATRDQGYLLAIDISTGNQVSSFLPVIWMTEGNLALSLLTDR